MIVYNPGADVKKTIKKSFDRLFTEVVKSHVGVEHKVFDDEFW